MKHIGLHKVPVAATGRKERRHCHVFTAATVVPRAKALQPLASDLLLTPAALML